MKRTLAASIGAALLALPAGATAHDATVACIDNRIVVTPDFLQFSPTWTVGDTNVTVRWTDGFVREYPIPEACEAPPTPAPVPPVPEVIPQPVVVPLPPVSIAPPVAISPPKTSKPKPKPKPKPKRKITTRYFPCVINGKRARIVITVTLPSGKVGKVTRYGKKCKSIAVTG